MLPKLGRVQIVTTRIRRVVSALLLAPFSREILVPGSARDRAIACRHGRDARATAGEVVLIGRGVASLARPVASLTRPVVSLARPVASLTRPVVSLARPVVSLARPVVSLARPMVFIGRRVIFAGCEGLRRNVKLRVASRDGGHR